MQEETERTRIAKEDVLRILGEREGKAPAEYVFSQLEVRPSLFRRALKELGDEELTRKAGEEIELTAKGKTTAEIICRKHVALEKYWFSEATRSEEESHRAAHLLEHQVSERVLDNIRDISQLERDGVPLLEFGKEEGQEGVITDILLSGKSFERLVSMGFSPGEKVKIRAKLPNSVIIALKNKKIALEREIASKIRVLAEPIIKGSGSDEEDQGGIGRTTERGKELFT